MGRGALMSATLDIATMIYLLFRFFNLINVATSFIYDLFGFQIKDVEPETERAESPEEVILLGVGNRRADPTTPEARIQLYLEAAVSP